MTDASGKLVRLADVPPVTWGGEEAGRWLLRGADTGGLYSLYEVRVPAGHGTLVHVHQDADEACYVIDGEFEITVGEVAHEAPANVLVYGPRGVAHSFRNTWHQPSTMLCITTPGGIEEFFEELSALMNGASPPEWSQMRALAARHRITPVSAPSSAAEGA
jgi:mannose-6-phosphate isomerase-like protein (cupin superfamily)